MKALLFDGKYTTVLNEKYADRVSIIEEINHMTGELGKLMEEHHSDDPFMETALQFALMNLETPRCLLLVLAAGHVTQAYILLRWHFEMTYLCRYLWQEPEEYEAWKNDKRVKPENIGKFFIDIGLPSGREQYEEWCNIVHGNYNFVHQSHLLSVMGPIKPHSVMIVGEVLNCLMANSQRMNSVFLNLLKNGGITTDDIERRFDEIGDRVIKALEDQNTIYAEFIRDNQTQRK